MLTSRRDFFVFGALQTCLPSTSAAALVTLTVLFRSDFCWESERGRRRAAARKAQKNAQPIKYQLGVIGCILLNYDTV